VCISRPRRHSCRCSAAVAGLYLAGSLSSQATKEIRCTAHIRFLSISSTRSCRKRHVVDGAMPREVGSNYTTGARWCLLTASRAPRESEMLDGSSASEVPQHLVQRIPLLPGKARNVNVRFALGRVARLHDCDLVSLFE
jgi:hypothetical protein